jgi:hypothetical chaperone protein
MKRSEKRSVGVGLDFGTTNSSIGMVDPAGNVTLAKFNYSGGITEAYRSVLYLEQIRKAGRSTIKSWTGPVAIDQYLQAEEKGRLVQSLKSFLTSRTLKSTEVFGRQQTLEDLVAVILRDIRQGAEQQFQTPVTSIVAGRPVRFVGAELPDDDAFAESRLELAMHKAGFEHVSFELEPIGAAHFYESTLDHDELILIGDFGGGTSDFSLLRVGPAIRKRGRQAEDLLTNEGLGLAGDAFDAKIIRHLVSPALGSGTSLKSMDKVLPVPNWVYMNLERWHHLSLLRTKDVLHMLKSVKAQAFEPDKIEALLHLIKNDLGYHLHRAVQQLKCSLSDSDLGAFHFVDGDVSIDATVTRAQFEGWISDELEAIEGCVDSTLVNAGVAAKDVDMVFLTGGTSFVPAVRRIFDSRFGRSRIRTGNEFTSVAHGLALKSAATQA